MITDVSVDSITFIFRVRQSKPSMAFLDSMTRNLNTFLRNVGKYLSFHMVKHRAVQIPKSQVVLLTKLCTMAPNTFGSSVYNFLHGNLLERISLKWLRDFWKLLKVLYMYVRNESRQGQTIQMRLHISTS